MNKNEFLSTLSANLSILPPEERDDLMNDYETHFAFGLQNGKTETEIVQELGDPEELAREAIGERRFPQDPVYWFASNHNQEQPQQPAPAVPAASPRSIFATVMVCIGLFFVDIVAVPFLAALWLFGLSFILVAASGIISPVLVLLDYMMQGTFFPAKGFASIAFLGVGILLAMLSSYVIKGLLVISRKFFDWNMSAIKGGNTK